MKNTQNDNQVESEESEQGEEIEVDEEALPSRAAAVHEQIRQEGRKSWNVMPSHCCFQL